MAELYKKYVTTDGKIGTLIHIYPDKKNGTFELDDKNAIEVVFDIELSKLKES